MKPDPIAVLVSLTVLILGSVGLPQRLGLSAAAVMAIGGGVVAAVATTRAIVIHHRHAPVDWRDFVGACVGVLAASFGIAGVVADGSPLMSVDPDLATMIGSGLATAFAAHRADFLGEPTDPPTTGLVLLVGMALSCTVSDGTVVRVAEASGLHDVEPGHWAPISCGKDDQLRTSFKAKNVAGKTVHGVVCCGYFKQCTVRFE